MQKIIAQIAQEIRVEARQVLAVNGAASVPGVTSNCIDATGLLGRV